MASQSMASPLPIGVSAQPLSNSINSSANNIRCFYLFNRCVGDLCRLGEIFSVDSIVSRCMKQMISTQAYLKDLALGSIHGKAE